MDDRRRGKRALDDDWVRAALALANPTLLAAPTGAARAIENYLARARFRPTPHGWWAGVGMAQLGKRTRLRTGRLRAHVTVAWARLRALGRALLDDPAFREEARLRVAPSLLPAAERVTWLAPGDDAQAIERVAELDETLGRVLEAARVPTLFSALRAHVEPVDAADEYLLSLIDDGLLVHDFEPPLVGPPPLGWMQARLDGRLPALDELAATLDEHPRDLDAARALLDELPGASPDAPLHAALVHELGRAEIARAPLERAARLAPVLFRLQDALTPPVAERALDPSVRESLDGVTEVLGAGALDVAALANGEYGDTPGTAPGSAAAGALASPRPFLPPPLLLAYLVEQLTSAGDAEEIALDPGVLDALLPTGDPPPSFELILTPRATSEGWLLALHAPAGATWGRFAHALGEPMTDALASLDAAERAQPVRRLDVAYAPTAALADLTAHPPVRAAALALTTWADDAVPPRALSLVADAAALDPMALRDEAGAVLPSPLHRLRSTTAPPGVFQLLTGFALCRQHAPWALTLGPLGAIAYVPRIAIDGFVVQPRSWRVPELPTAAALKAWRRAMRVPRHVQVGHEDELLLVDLDSADARETVTRFERVHEVWPPLGDTPDAGGRRIELVAAVVREPDERMHAASRAVADAGRVRPPRVQAEAPDWHTFKLFGAADRLDRVLGAAIAPLVRAERAAERVDGWFFLRYLDPPRRAHLRLRVRTDAVAAFRVRLDDALEPARAAGDLVAVERVPYFRELARYGEDAMDAVERVFEADSELACTWLERDEDPGELQVRAFDALATAFGLELDDRRELARRRRAAYAAELVPVDAALAADFRARQATLQAALTGAADEALDLYVAVVRAAVSDVPVERRRTILPALLHLSSVRLQGLDPLAEARAVYLWERTLDGLQARARRGR
jgi:thiopeptide-type bacteriocin biosynthesis protein